MMRSLRALAGLLVLAISAPSALGQTIMPAPGCVVGVACSAGSLVVTGRITLGNGAGNGLYFSGGAAMTSNSTNNLLVYDAAQTSFNLLQFGCTTSACPAIKRSGASLALRLADDTAAASWLGTATNDNAIAGAIGEWSSTPVLVGSAVALTSATAKDVITVSLTVGDWEVRGSFCLHPNTVSALNQIAAAFTTTTNTLPTSGSVPGYTSLLMSLNSVTDQCVSLAETRFSLSATTTVRMVGLTNYTGTSVGGYGVIEARRAR